LFRLLGCASPLYVVNSSPSAAQRQQRITVGESLPARCRFFPGVRPAGSPLVVPSPRHKTGETVSKERLRFDTRWATQQRKIALGNLNGVNLQVKIV